LYLVPAVIVVLLAAGCGSSHPNGYFNMHKLAEAVAQEKLQNPEPEGPAIPTRHEELCILTGKQTAECQFPVLRFDQGASESRVEKRTVKVTISTDGKSYIAH
jgi:hypothetical protein